LIIGSEKDGVVESNHKDIDSRVVVCNDPTVNMPVSKSPHPKNEKMSAISPKSGTISTVVRSFKSAVTNYCNQLGLDIVRQPRFHGIIKRDEGSFRRISKYIKNNQIGLKMNYSAN
jgi:hypothetical protein